MIVLTSKTAISVYHSGQIYTLYNNFKELRINIENFVIGRVGHSIQPLVVKNDVTPAFSTRGCKVQGR